MPDWRAPMRSKRLNDSPRALNGSAGVRPLANIRGMSGWSSAVAWGLALLLSALAWFYAPGDAAPPGVTIDGAQMRQGPGEWTAVETTVLATWSGPYELRWRLHLEHEERALVLRLALRGASELRCNGQLVLINGQPGATASAEVPGQVDRWLALPSLPAGTHELHVLASSHHIPAGQFRHAHAVVLPMTLEAMPRQRFARWLVVALAWGGLALTWLYFLRLQPLPGGPSPRSRAHRWSLIALGAVGLLLPIAESARDLWGYAYPLHVWRLQTILACTLLAAWLLPLTLALRWGWPRRLMPWSCVWAVTLLLWVTVTLPGHGYDVASWWLHVLGVVAALILAARMRHQANEPTSALLTLLLLALALLLLYPAAFLDGLYTVTLAMVMTLLMLGHAGHQQAQALAEAGQRQALQAQLLRAGMQPHGLMNTLTVLQELIDQRPAIASRLVERLADQFNLLRVLSQKALVSLREELALVRTQLDLVEMAREMPLPLGVHGPVDGVFLPPGVLHTLVENAITHGGVRAGAPAFSLHIEACTSDRWRLELRSPRGAGRDGGGGQGQRFVRESLAGTFGSGWSYEAGPLDEAVWLDSLSFPRR
jgi:hypothetical protein